jgi:flap endonuclease-1
MGVKKFGNVFKPDSQITFKELEGCVVAVDAMAELYRSNLGINDVNALTDPEGKPSIFLRVIQALILNLYKEKVKQIWVFDNVHGGSVYKSEELKNRRQKRKQAQQQMEKIMTITPDCDNPDDILDNLLGSSLIESKQNIEAKIQSLKKRTFTVETWMIEDVQFMLDKLGIPWMEAPVGYEGEHIAACLTKNDIAHAVLSPDYDTLIFGAKQLIKRDTSKTRSKSKKVYYLYILEKLRESYKITQDDLIKIALCLGTDFNKKIKGIGEKTVLKKYHIISDFLEDNVDNVDDKYVEEIKNAYNYFKKECPIDIGNINNYNLLNEPLSDGKKINEYLEWLVECKGYNMDSSTRIIENAIYERTHGKKPKRKK